MPSVFADRIKPEGENLERYVQLYKVNPGVGVPILRERLHYSFIWDKMPLTGMEDINLRDERDKEDEVI